MDNQDQHYGGGGARKEGDMDGGRRKNVGGITISDETAAEEEAVHGGASGSNRSSGGTINQDGIIDLTGSPPETAGSNRAVSEDNARTLNLPETTDPGSAVNRESSSARPSLRPLHVRITHLIKDFQDSARRRAGGGGYNSSKAAAPPEPPENRRQMEKGKGKAAAVDQYSFIPNYFPPLDGQDQPPFKKLNIGGGGGGCSQTSASGGGYCQTSGGGGIRYIQYSGGGGSGGSGGRYYSQTSGGGAAGGSGHNSSIASAVTISALPPRPPRPRDGYSQTSGAGGGGSGHNSSIAEAAAAAALPPRPPQPDDYVCMYCNWARFRSRQALEEHMIPCSLLFLKGA